MSFVMTPFMMVACIAYTCFLFGIVLRRDRRKHVLLMSAGIFLDVSLVLTLEIQRSAIETAIGLQMKPLQSIHVSASTLALIQYFPQIYYGYQLKRGREITRKKHRWLGGSIFFFRTVGFIFMFSLLWK